MNVNQAITVGEIDFGTAANITIGTLNNSTLTLSSTGKSIINAFATNTGTDSINVPLDAATPLSATVSGGRVQLGNANSGTGLTNTIGSTSSFTVNGGALAVLDPSNTDAANITVGNGGTFLVTGGGNLCRCFGPDRGHHGDRELRRHLRGQR